MYPKIETMAVTERREQGLLGDSLRFLALGALILSVGCGGDDPPPEGVDPCESLFISLQSGNDQLGRPGATLDQPVTLQLVDGFQGSPEAQEGCVISWAVSNGAGSVEPGGLTTGSDGTASALWTLGSEEGGQSLTATLAAQNVSTVASAVALDSARAVVYTEVGSAGIGGIGGTLYLMNPDGSERTQLTSGLFVDKFPEWSPEGTRIAFVRKFTETCTPLQGDVMVLDVEALTLRRLTDDGACAEAERVSWSPDGSSLVVDRDDDLIVIDVASGAQTTLLGTADREHIPAWGPGGVAYGSRPSGDDPFDLHLVDGMGGTPVVLRSGSSDLIPSHWSPDGNRLAVFRRSPAGSLDWDLGIYDLDSDSFGGVQGSERAFHATFSPDGTRLIVTVDGFLSGGPCASVSAHYLITLDLTAGTQTDLTEPCGKRSLTAHWRPTG